MRPDGAVAVFPSTQIVYATIESRLSVYEDSQEMITHVVNDWSPQWNKQLEL